MMAPFRETLDMGLQRPGLPSLSLLSCCLRLSPSCLWRGLYFPRYFEHSSNVCFTSLKSRNDTSPVSFRCLCNCSSVTLNSSTSLFKLFTWLAALRGPSVQLSMMTQQNCTRTKRSVADQPKLIGTLLSRQSANSLKVAFNNIVRVTGNPPTGHTRKSKKSEDLQRMGREQQATSLRKPLYTGLFGSVGQCE